MKTIIKMFAAVLVTVTLFAGTTTIKAQEYTTLYFSSQPQAATYNPAFMTNNSVFVTFPVLGRFGLDLHTSGFAYNDLIHQHPQYADSLQLDCEGFLSALKKNNNFSLGLNLELFGVGFKIKKNYFSIGSNLNIESKLGFSKGLMDFLVHGTNIASHNVDLLDSKLVDVNAYMATYIGYAREINEHLTIGAKLKMYTGIANIQTKNSTVHLDFDENEISAYGNFDINASMAFGYFKAMSSVIDNHSDFGFESEDNASDMISNAMKNKGFGFDIGATYRLNDKMEFSASIIDIGKITWKSNAANIKSRNPNEKISFSGLATDYDNISDDFETYFDDMADSLKRAFDLDVNNVASYSTSVPTKIYLGYTWEFFPHMQLQALYNGRIINGSLENALTVNYAYGIGPLYLSIGNTFKYTWFNPTVLLSLGNVFYVGTSFSSSYNLAKTSGMTVFLGLNFAIKNKHKLSNNIPAVQPSESETSWLESQPNVR